MKTLSTEAEQQIITAAKTAVDLVDNDGLTPNSAIEKVARQEKFGRHKIRFLSHAYNNGRQTAQREASDDVLDKFASFPLADADAIIGSIYPAEAPKMSKAASDDYSRPPAWLADQATTSQRLMRSGYMEKAAAEQLPAAPAVKPPVMADVYNKHLQFKKQAEEARHQAGSAYDNLVVSMGLLGEYFQKSAYDRIPFSHIEFGASAYFGKAGEQLTDYIYVRNRMKEARAGDKPPPFVAVDFTAAPWSLLAECVKLAADVNEKRAAEAIAIDSLEKHACVELAPFISIRRTVKRSADSIMPEPDLVYYEPENLKAFLPHLQKEAVAPKPVVKKAAEWSVLEYPATKAADATDMAGDYMPQSAKTLMDNAFKQAPVDEKVRDAYTDLDDPAHNSQLRQIRSQALLADLMNDDAISEHDPEEVMRVYNEISQLAPRVAEQPIAIRALLRQHLQKNPSEHELSGLTGLEKGVMDVSSGVPDPSIKPTPPAPAAKKSGDYFGIMEDAELCSIL